MNKEISRYRIEGLWSLIYSGAPIDIRYRAYKLLFCGKYGDHEL